MVGAQLMKRIPRIKFPNRHSHQSGSLSKNEAGGGSITSIHSGNGDDITFFSSLQASGPVGGKASLQPKRTPLSKEEIEAILLGGNF